MTSIDVETRLVQLSSAATTFNTTLNLTGPIILGVTIAFGSLLYAYSKAYPPQLSVAGNIGLLSDSLSSLAKPSGGYGRGYTKRAAEERDQDQAAALGAVLDTFSLLQSVEDSLALIGVDTADCQLRAVCDIVAGTFPAPAVDTVTQVLPDVLFFAQNNLPFPLPISIHLTPLPAGGAGGGVQAAARAAVAGAARGAALAGGGRGGEARGAVRRQLQILRGQEIRRQAEAAAGNLVITGGICIHSQHMFNIHTKYSQ